MAFCGSRKLPSVRSLLVGCSMRVRIRVNGVIRGGHGVYVRGVERRIA